MLRRRVSQQGGFRTAGRAEIGTQSVEGISPGNLADVVLDYSFFPRPKAHANRAELPPRRCRSILRSRVLITLFQDCFKFATFSTHPYLGCHLRFLRFADLLGPNPYPHLPHHVRLEHYPLRLRPQHWSAVRPRLPEIVAGADAHIQSTGKGPMF